MSWTCRYCESTDHLGLHCPHVGLYDAHERLEEVLRQNRAVASIRREVAEAERLKNRKPLEGFSIDGLTIDEWVDLASLEPDKASDLLKQLKCSQEEPCCCVGCTAWMLLVEPLARAADSPEVDQLDRAALRRALGENS